MTNKLTTDTIKKLLDQSAAGLDAGTIDNLRASRSKALERHQTLQHAPVAAWLSQHGLLGWISHRRSVNWAAALLLLACMLSAANYMQQISEHDHSDIDIEILTDELPVDAYID